MEKRVRFLVVDSGAFIKASPVHEYAENIYTVSGAIQEIKDKATLERLQFLPYTLKVKEPSAEACKYVTEFSKKTGDYANLSAVDLQILALTYQLEKENVGIEHLNKEPSCKITNKSSFSDTQISGFYVPKKNSKSQDSSVEPTNLGDGCASDGEKVEDSADMSVGQKHDDPTNISSKISEIDENQEEDSEEIDDSESDEADEDSWLTPQNISKVQEKMGGLKLDSSITVACVTTDFCIQNVLIQLGLKVVSLEGMLIKHARVFVLRCFSCYKTTNDSSKVFCPNCGNKTLKRVSVTVNDDGTKNIHINFRRPINIRGTRYSLPLPKGGKHSTDPVICEDQPIPHNRPGKKALQKIDVMDVDYITRSSPFALNDVTSRAARVGVRANRSLHVRKNPNSSSKSTGNRKK